METPDNNRKRLGPVAIASFCFLGALAILYLFDPTRYHFYPTCPLYQMTGLLCPACGALRATHQLAHGHVAAAFHFNPLFVILSPLAAWVGLRWVVLECTGKCLPPVSFTRWWPLALFVTLVVFGIARNLPFAQAGFSGL